MIEAVARKEDISPSELSPPLFSAVEPEALDALVQSDADSDPEQIEVTFTYLDYVVQVQSGPTVSISIQGKNAPES
ncbi:hypothetical protein C446_03601 [Halobiforma nitratireducens JCM 10879]|uniref:Halobacterial output domain-containing protein n=1 Tax=Halobiforma nitratireducens JCM 10879 TaxID=1227454 RepID=M0MEX1_9EURY|nr:hypothetical protein C446_03601 [Halobiforma nitratireducens JCM 10879]